MLSLSKKNLYLLELFKIATAVHIFCLLANLIIRPYLAPDNFINVILEYSILASVIAISIIVGIKAMQIFKQNHEYLMHHYKFIGLIIEIFIAVVVANLLYLNQEITGKFVLFLGDISKQVHSNKIILLIVLLTLWFSVELYRSYGINKKSIDAQSIRKKIYFHGITFILKLFIIVGTAIGFIHPIIKIFDDSQLKQFDTIIFRFTTSDFFIYIHTIIIILLGLWTIIGIYYVYNFYKK
ncbi:MAG: hypothetical protein JO129_00840 [Candidatus Dependentiae bacterium]|nr:hypothetical protein [Candidatus Dependentiae bacterium]